MGNNKIKESHDKESALPLGIGPTHDKTEVRDTENNVKGVGRGSNKDEATEKAYQDLREKQAEKRSK